MKSYCVYILECSDGTYYTGSTSNLERRIWEHETGADPKSYTSSRRPVKLLWAEEMPTKEAALSFEHQIKGWNRKKKEALIRGDWDGIHQIVKDERKSRETRKKQGVEL